MRLKLLLSGSLVTLMALAYIALPIAKAATLSSMEGGDIYRARNLTTGTSFVDPVNADKCQELQYRVRLHNPGPDEVLNNVTVQASIPQNATTSNVSTVIVRTSNGNPATVSDTATVNMPAAYKISYVPGSSQLLDASGNFIRSIADVTSGSGVDIGSVGISINERRFVQFNAKVECPTPPQPEKKFACTALNATFIDRTRYKLTAVASVQNVTVQSYVFNVRKDNGAEVDTKTVTTNATTADYEFNQSEPGTYLVSVVIKTDAGDTDPGACVKQITVPKEGTPPPPPVTPPTNPPVTPGSPSSPSYGGGGGGVSALPAAGPTSVVGIFTGVTVISSLAYYVISRKLSV